MAHYQRLLDACDPEGKAASERLEAFRSSKDNIRLSWRLIALSDEEIEYVAAHELAHLMEFNHSPAFWREVGEILPDWRERHERIEARRMNEMLDAL